MHDYYILNKIYNTRGLVYLWFARPFIQDTFQGGRSGGDDEK